MTMGTERMTEAQEQDLEDIKKGFQAWVDEKYRKGQQEHGGNLWEMSVLDFVEAAIEEAVDQFTYLWEARKKLILEEEQGKARD